MTEQLPRWDEQIPDLHYPAHYANRFHIIVGPITTRISFAEEAIAGSPWMYHTAVVLKTSDAKQLGEILLKLIEQSETQPQEN